MGQLESMQHQPYPTTTPASFNNQPKQNRTLSIEHEGILKSRSVPFRDGLQYSEIPLIFMEKYDATLENLLQDRFQSNRLFTEDDLICLLQSVLYTLAYLELQNVAYANLSTRYIYYVAKNSQFKLHPIQLHTVTSFNAVKNNDLKSPPSPQMIISIRAGNLFLDNTLAISSNLFCFGMIMLECLSLKNSTTCYDPYNLDILDKQIQIRLRQAQEFYSERLLGFVKQMLVYDCSERVSARNLALLFNREMMEGNGSRLKKVNQTPIRQNLGDADGQIRGSHIDKLSGLAEQPISGSVSSYRDYVTTGRPLADTQSMKSSNLSIRKRSVSPARIPGYKATGLPPMSQPCISRDLRQSGLPSQHPPIPPFPLPTTNVLPPSTNNAPTGYHNVPPAQILSGAILSSKLADNWSNTRTQIVKNLSPSVSNAQLSNNSVKLDYHGPRPPSRTPERRELSPPPVPHIKFQYHNQISNQILRQQQPPISSSASPNSYQLRQEQMSPSQPKPFTAHFQSQQKMPEKYEECPREWTLQEGDSIARIRQQIEKSRKLIKQLELDTKKNL